MIITDIDESYEIKEERQEYLPEYFKKGVTTESTVSELKIMKSVWQHASANTPLWRFASPIIEIRSSKPVSVNVLKGESLFFAENENLGIFTTGESRDDAINAFCELLIHFYNHYVNLHWNQVTGDARRYKRFYEDFFQKVSK